MQLSPPSISEDSSSEIIEDRIEDRIFAIGDCADAFGAIQSGNAAYWQANVASRNVLRLIQRQDGSEAEALEEYKPNPPMIKVTLGLVGYGACCSGDQRN
jgi:apoptosis-inducing factor 2